MKSIPNLLLHSALLVHPFQKPFPGWLCVANGCIHSMGTGSPPLDLEKTGEIVIDAKGAYLLPGFIDTHVHGAAGVDVMDASVDGILEMARFFIRHGVTSFLPTTWAAGYEEILNVLGALREAMKANEGGARILGVHLEGPFLNEKYSGAQNPRHIFPARPDEARKLLESGLVRILTLAPEIPENQWLLGECHNLGIVTSAGHTGASFEQIQIAVAAGLSHVTHCFNAMPAFHHRRPGTIGAALLMDDISCEIIADGHHVHPAAIQLLAKLKGPDRIILVTDAIRGTGMPEGTFILEDRVIDTSSGAARLPDGTLAGSVLTMEKALSNLLQYLDAPIEEWVQTSSLNAAHLLGLSDRLGVLEVGKDADLVLLSPQGIVRMTLIQGRIVFLDDGPV